MAQVRQYLYVPGDGRQFVEILSEIMKCDSVCSNKEIMQYFTPKAESNSVVQEYLVFTEEKYIFSNDSLSMLKILRDMLHPTIPLGLIFEKIRQILSQIPSVDKIRVGWAFNALLTVGFRSNAKSYEILSDGKAFDFYYTLNAEQGKINDDLRCTIILLSIMFNPVLASSMFNNSQLGINLINQHRNDDSFVNFFAVFAESAIHHADVFEVLIESANGISEWNKVIRELISYKLHKNNDLGSINASLLTDKLHMIFYYITDESTLSLLGSYIGGQPWFFEGISRIKDDVTAFKAFELLDNTNFAQKSDAAFFEYISQKDSKWWKTAFEQVSESYFPINKLATIQPNFHNKELSSDFFQALEEYLDVFKGDAPIRLPLETHNWFNLLFFADNDKRTVFLSNAYDIIINSSTDLNANTLLILYFNAVSSSKCNTQSLGIGVF